MNVASLVGFAFDLAAQGKSVEEVGLYRKRPLSVQLRCGGSDLGCRSNGARGERIGQAETEDTFRFNDDRLQLKHSRRFTQQHGD